MKAKYMSLTSIGKIRVLLILFLIWSIIAISTAKKGELIVSDSVETLDFDDDIILDNEEVIDEENDIIE